MKQLLVNLWNWSYDQRIRINDWIHLLYDFIYRHIIPAPYIASNLETIDYIVKHRCSVSRFGDAEMKVAKGMDISYQKNAERLTKMMRKVLRNPIPNHIVCLPDVFGNLDIYTEDNRKFWRKHLAYFRRLWYREIDRRRLYFNAFMSRCYMPYVDKNNVKACFDGLKKIWNGRDLLLVEGERSRLGFGNDLFDNAKSVKRILGPNLSAFDVYDKMYEEILKYDSKQYVVLLALGPTATVMAYELAKVGYQAVDIGHVDVEYEWWKMGATQKIPLKNKYVHEASYVTVEDPNDGKYQKEIVWHY